MLEADQVLRGASPDDPVARVQRVDTALAPARDRFRPADLKKLTRALALVVGTEAVVVFKYALQLDDAEARKVTCWAIGALVQAARKPKPVT